MVSTRATRSASSEITNIGPGSEGKPANEPPNKRRRINKTKSVETVPTEDETSDLPPVRVKTLWKAGAHVSAAGGIHNAVLNASKIGANSFALFLKSQRKWTSPPLQPDVVSSFQSLMKKHGYDPKKDVLPHGSYLINLANPDEEKRQKSLDCFVDDLKRCEEVGLGMYNFHPGSSLGQIPFSTAISNIAQSINQAHRLTSSVITVIENMAGTGNVVGGKFEDLGAIIQEVECKERVGVCLDTCHAFAAGYDIRTKEGWDNTLNEFDKHIGLKYLRGMHLNDSKGGLACKKDRHENMGLGHLGITAFHHVLNDPRTQGIPLILETPSQERDEIWRTEIEVLNSLSASASTSSSTREDSNDSSATRVLEIDMQEMEKKVELIRAVVSQGEGGTNVKKGASKAKSMKTKKEPKGKPGKNGKKGKKKKDESDEESECGSEHDE